MSFLVNFQSNWSKDALCTLCTNVQVSPKANDSLAMRNDLGTNES
jgi:hypothetical protein